MGNNGKALLADNRIVPERFKPLTRSGNVMIACDLHIPLHDNSLVNELIYTAKKNRIKKLICGGDYFNMDSFSHYPPNQTEADFPIEKEEGAKVMNALFTAFDEIDFIWGNHEHRIARKLDFKISFTTLMEFMLSDVDKKKIEKIRFSELDYMYLKQRNRTIRICHPPHFSKVPLTVPRQLALKYNCSVLAAHSHHLAMGFALDGHNLIMEGGGLFDKAKTQYIQRTTTHHEWVPGFTMFRDNIPHMFSPAIGNL